MKGYSIVKKAYMVLSLAVLAMMYADADPVRLALYGAAGSAAALSVMMLTGRRDDIPPVGTRERAAGLIMAVLLFIPACRAVSENWAASGLLARIAGMMHMPVKAFIITAAILVYAVFIPGVSGIISRGLC